MDELLFIGFFIGLPVGAAVLGVAWLAARRRVRRYERLLGSLATPEDRLDLIDQRLDEIASRLEQLARGQEFLGRLLSKSQARLARAAERSELSPPN